jgi:hypothetical protein
MNRIAVFFQETIKVWLLRKLLDSLDPLIVNRQFPDMSMIKDTPFGPILIQKKPEAVEGNWQPNSETYIALRDKPGFIFSFVMEPAENFSAPAFKGGDTEVEIDPPDRIENFLNGQVPGQILSDDAAESGKEVGDKTRRFEDILAGPFVVSRNKDTRPEVVQPSKEEAPAIPVMEVEGALFASPSHFFSDDHNPRGDDLPPAASDQAGEKDAVFEVSVGDVSKMNEAEVIARLSAMHLKKSTDPRVLWYAHGADFDVRNPDFYIRQDLQHRLFRFYREKDADWTRPPS